MTDQIIKLKDVSKSYSMGEQRTTVIPGLNLHIQKNEFVAIMGPSGSGKSTLMNALGCLDRFDSGSYHLNGKDVSKFSPEELAQVRNEDIGFVFQMFNLLPNSTALDNVALPLLYAGISKSKREERAKELLDKVGLSERMRHRPRELSGGQQQRIAVARALVNRPAILLADEPTGNLDSKTTRDIMDLFVEIHSQGNTVIFITHEDDIAEYADRVIILKDGIVARDYKNN